MWLFILVVLKHTGVKLEQEERGQEKRLGRLGGGVEKEGEESECMS